MKQTNDVTTPAIHSATLATRMLQGGGIAFILICLFLFLAGEPNPGWPKFWMLRPLIVVPIAGAAGGALYYFMDHLRYQGGWLKVLAIILSILGYIIILWLGTVFGLSGTMWD